MAIPMTIDENIYDQLIEIIKQQYIDFNNLGSNLLDPISKPYKNKIYNEISFYYSENYDILQLELHDDDDKLGEHIYNFCCIDFYSTILPSFLEHYKIYSYSEFESYLSGRIAYNMSYLKTGFLKIINEILLKFQNLQLIDKAIVNNKDFLYIFEKYKFYLLLINNSDIESLLKNYIIPLFVKNETDIIWKIE